MTSSVLSQVRWEQKSFWRNPAAASFTFAFPLMFLVVFVAINGNDTVGVRGGEVRYAQYYVPSIVAFGVISACYTNLAFTISIRRENGLLKRVRGTPLPPLEYLLGILGGVMVVAAILTALVIALGIVVYGISFPGRYLALVLSITAGAFCFSSLGVAMSTLVPNEDAAPAIINFALFPLLFISGTFGPVAADSVPGRIAGFFPVRPLTRSIVDAFDPLVTGSGISPGHLGVMLAWGVVGVVVSLRRFRWEPRR
jgi:ABC-2 type transport system permease protein